MFYDELLCRIGGYLLLSYMKESNCGNSAQHCIQAYGYDIIHGYRLNIATLNT